MANIVLKDILSLQHPGKENNRSLKLSQSNFAIGHVLVPEAGHCDRHEGLLEEDVGQGVPIVG